MPAEEVLRITGLRGAACVVALVLAAAPAAPGLDAGYLGLKSAQAKNNGKSNGAGNNGVDGGDVHGKSAGGHAKAGGKGHNQGLSTEEFHLDAENHGLTAAAMKDLNAGHASIQGFAHASDTSKVGQIRLAVQRAYKGEAENETISTVDENEVDDDDFAQALAEIMGVEDPEINPVSDDVLNAVDDVLNAVKDLVDDKVAVPSEEDSEGT